jgi:hypothetical protein
MRRYAVGECGDGGALPQSVRRYGAMAGSERQHHTARVCRGHNQSSARAGRRGRGHPAQRETGYDADSRCSGGGRRAHARHEGEHAREPIGGTECARRKARGCPICGERAGQQAAGAGKQAEVRQFRGGRRRHVRRRMAVYSRTTGWPLRPGGIFAAAAGGGRALACRGLGRRRRGPGRAKHNIEPWC